MMGNRNAFSVTEEVMKVMIVQLLRSFFVLQGMYPSTLLKSRGRHKLAKVQVIVSSFLIAVTLCNILRDVQALSVVGQSDFGVGGPTVFYSIVAIQIFLHCINLAVRVFLFLRVSLSPDFPQTLHRHTQFFGKLEQFKCGLNEPLTSKWKWNRLVFLVIATVELVMVSREEIFPEVTDQATKKFHASEGWVAKCARFLGIAFSAPVILDGARLAAMIYMDFLTQSLSDIRCEIKRTWMDPNDIPDDEGSLEVALVSPVQLEKRNKKLRKSGEDELREFMLNDLRRCELRFKGNGHKTPRGPNPVLFYEELCELWDSTKGIWGFVFFLSISTGTIRLISDTFHLVSATIDIGSIFDPTVIHFYIICAFLWIKLIVFTNCAQEVQDQVDMLQRLLVQIKYNISLNRFHLTKPSGCSLVEIRKLEEYLRRRRFEADAFRVFVVKRKTFTSIVSVISNYMVVLLQFWMSSSKSKALAEM